jgi:LmbE family N-acetylglucosaminyl deacetylase
MLRIDLFAGGRPPGRVLCLGAHCDDIEIGCGGTLMDLLDGGRDMEAKWVVFSSDETRAVEARQAAGIFLGGAARKDVAVHGFRDGFLPGHWGEVKEAFERIKRDYSPDLIFTHYRGDAHQDHRIVSDLTWNTFRDHLILEYEIPKYDGDLGSPNAFFPLTESAARRKAAAILETYRSQAGRNWFSEDTFLSLMRLRGIEANAPEKYAEAFYCRKLVFA